VGQLIEVLADKYMKER